jgi:hypothetical protein
MSAPDTDYDINRVSENSEHQQDLLSLTANSPPTFGDAVWVLHRADFAIKIHSLADTNEPRAM